MNKNSSRTLAAIDLGTNSVLLSIAKVENGKLVIIDQRMTVTRMGQDVDRTGKLHPDAIARNLKCLTEYRAVIDEHGVTHAHAVGTSAMRDAQGGEEFRAQAQEILGFAPEVISGSREAELTFRGALSDLSHQGPTFVFDIGGGSTEFIVGEVGDDLNIEQGVSLNIGSVRLTERCKPSDPPTPADVERIRDAVREAIADCPVKVAPGTQAVGVAGTVTTLAAIAENMSDYDPHLIHGYSLKLCDVQEIVDRLAALTVEQRKSIPGLSPGRADVIVSGSILCEEIMSWSGASSLIVSDRGVRFGLLAELAAQ